MDFWSTLLNGVCILVYYLYFKEMGDIVAGIAGQIIVPYWVGLYVAPESPVGCQLVDIHIIPMSSFIQLFISL